MTLLDWASDYKIESQPPTSKSNKSKTFKNTSTGKVDKDKLKKMLSNNNYDSDSDDDDIADFNPPKKAELTKLPDDITDKNIIKNLGYMPQNVQDINIDKELNKHYNNNVSHPFLNSKDDLMTQKINYMIELLEEQKNEKTQNITEELILYCFLGIFVIFIVDSFVKVGKTKYKR
tara:strand:+ start:4033 stop:4557 length:525 start_codon:yes stop_codon:yes gene_type:complete